MEQPEERPNVKVDPTKSFLPPWAELEAIKILNSVQVKAMKHVVDSSKKLSFAAYPRVLVKMKGLGYTEEDLKRTLWYIRDEAPITIHFHPTRVLQILLKDTHYKNQFETHTSSGSTDLSARGGWEDNCFGAIYRGASPSDRVKYGVLNIVRDPTGVQACLGYGDSFFILRKVRLRTSFASSDTSCSEVRIASCEYYCHVLESYSGEELKAVVDVAIGKTEHSSSSIISIYKEIQIHGEVRLNGHIDTLVLNVSYVNNKQIVKLAEDFALKNGCNWQFTNKPLPTRSLSKEEETRAKKQLEEETDNVINKLMTKS